MGKQSNSVESRQIGSDDRAEMLPGRQRDLELTAGIVQGDSLAFERLHALYRDRIFGFALKRLRDASEAEDVCQDVFLQVFRCIGSFEGRSSLLTWMFGIAHHQVCRRFRRRGLDYLSLDAPDAAEVVAEEVPTDEKVEAVRVLADCGRVLGEKVNDSQREVFHLRYARNYSTRAIANQLGKSNQAIKISLFRTRRTLAGQMENLDALLSA